MTRIKRPTQHYDMVEVVWDDASGFRHGWFGKTDELVPQLALSVGFLISETAEHIMIASDTDGEGNHNGRTQIPRGMVKNLKILRKATLGKSHNRSPLQDIQKASPQVPAKV